ncbi:hypothetical protein ACLUXJ_09210 [Lactobacillus porci]|uniref:hypothetical protein n=1 Tax=Lactobacillus porci TaxID=2012477 RepID=UPI003992CF0B
MKRKTLWTIIGIIAVAVLGGGFFYAQHQSSQNHSAAESYLTYMNEGKQAAKAKKYTAAASKFASAYKAKATSEAKHCQSQAENLRDSVHLAKTSTKYASAIVLAQKAKNETAGYSVMTTQAGKLVKTLKGVKDNYDSEIKPLMKKADSSMSSGAYSAAVSTYASILDLPYINEAYYAKVRADVKEDLKEAKEKAKDEDQDEDSSSSSSVSSSKESSASSSSKAASSSKKSSKSSSSSSSSQVEGAGQSVNDQVGGQTVTARDVQQIRNQLASLGEDSSGWSPQDLINLFRYANEQGHTTIDSITKDDVKGYLSPKK